MGKEEKPGKWEGGKGARVGKWKTGKGVAKR